MLTARKPCSTSKECKPFCPHRSFKAATDAGAVAEEAFIKLEFTSFNSIATVFTVVKAIAIGSKPVAEGTSAMSEDLTQRLLHCSVMWLPRQQQPFTGRSVVISTTVGASAVAAASYPVVALAATVSLATTVATATSAIVITVAFAASEPFS